MRTLTQAEHDALHLLLSRGGAVDVNDIPEKGTAGDFKEIPSIKVFRKLQKLGFVEITEEEPTIFDDGEEFTFSDFIYITAEGKEAMYD